MLSIFVKGGRLFEGGNYSRDGNYSKKYTISGELSLFPVVATFDFQNRG